MAEPGPVLGKPGVWARESSSVHLVSEGTEPVRASGLLADDNFCSGCGADITITAGTPAILGQSEELSPSVLMDLDEEVTALSEKEANSVEGRDALSSVVAKDKNSKLSQPVLSISSLSRPALILKSLGILAISEHWLHNFDLTLLHKAHPNLNVYATCHKEDNLF